VKYKRSSTPKNNREHQEQVNLIRWIHHYPQISGNLIAIPNGGKRPISEAKRLKEAGVQPGVSDLFLALPNDYSAGLWIELKAMQSNGYFPNPTDLQVNWLKRMRQSGYDGMVANGMEQARQQIIEHIQHTSFKQLFC